MEDAIQQLVDLGVTRSQAKKALSRYNNDVARAADFIFSGNYISDDDEEEEEKYIDRCRVEAPPQPAEISVKKVSEQRQYDSSQWSVVPFKPVEPAPPALVTSVPSKSSLTWWKDPEDPSERLALDDLPIGLRPPSYNFNYSPVLLQALFHISAFQYTVLSYRPTPYSWGQPLNYWKGFGEAVPGYMVQKVVTRKQVPPEAPLIIIDMEISEDDDEEEEIDLDRPPAIVETIEPSCDFIEQVEDELVLMPKCIQTMSELQKLFAFLGHTKRLYGSVSHFVRALNTKLTANGWDSSDKNYECKYIIVRFRENVWF
ncbi:hypothetical protein K501DRAFT_199353 [Backusella circina FSU 941]|nr:hypothetical protein K501DRAFT_199353 [Backusella circina FSU 941]